MGILELVPISSFRGLSEPGIKPVSLASPALADGFFTTEPPEDFPLKDLRSLKNNNNNGDIYHGGKQITVSPKETIIIY